MATSKTVICNMALSLLGTTKQISDLDNDITIEARTGRVWYDTARQGTLRDFNWPFAKKALELSLIEEEPTDEWDFSYSYPSDCLNFLRIQSGSGWVDTKDTRVQFSLGYTDTSQIIYTNQEDAIGEYTANVETVERFPPDFVIALAYRLASLMATGLTAGDPAKLGPKNYQLYRVEIAKANANSGNEQEVGEEPDSSFVRGR